MTEIYDYFRLLWGTIGIPTCPVCGKVLESTTIDEIIESLFKLEQGTKFIILAPKVRGKKGTQVDIIEEIKKRVSQGQ